jgi:hypothetical protein
VNDRDLQRDTERAEHAHRLLNDALLQEAINTIRSEVVRTWVATEHKAGTEREGLWMFAKTVDNFELLLRGYIETGKLARERLNVVERKGLLRRVMG